MLFFRCGDSARENVIGMLGNVAAPDDELVGEAACDVFGHEKWDFGRVKANACV